MALNGLISAEGRYESTHSLTHSLTQYHQQNSRPHNSTSGVIYQTVSLVTHQSIQTDRQTDTVSAATCSVRLLLSSACIHARSVSSVMKISAALANSTGASALIIYVQYSQRTPTLELLHWSSMYSTVNRTSAHNCYWWDSYRRYCSQISFNKSTFCNHKRTHLKTFWKHFTIMGHNSQTMNSITALIYNSTNSYNNITKNQLGLELLLLHIITDSFITHHSGLKIVTHN